MAKLDFSVLTPREYEVIKFILKGMMPREIASKLKLSQSSINTYVARAADRFGLKSRKFQKVFVLLTKARTDEAAVLLSRSKDLLSSARIQQAKFNEQSWNQWLFEREQLHTLLESHLELND